MNIFDEPQAEHSVTCCYPNGCVCGASAYNNLLMRMRKQLKQAHPIGGLVLSREAKGKIRALAEATIMSKMQLPARQREDAKAVLKALDDVAEYSPPIFTICCHCNREMKVDSINSGGMVVSTFQNCPNCGKRVDTWLRIIIGNPPPKETAESPIA